MARRVPETGASIDPGIGKADVQPAERTGMVVKGGSHRIEAGYIAMDGAGLVPRLAQEGGFALCTGQIDVCQGHCCAAFGHGLGIGKANATGSPGDQRAAPGDAETIDNGHDFPLR